MDEQYKNDFVNTIVNIYPGYLKENLLKKLVIKDYIINNKKGSGQTVINIDEKIDVSLLETNNEKLNKCFEDSDIINLFEEYEYNKKYRYFCYFKCSNISLEIIKNLIGINTFYLYDPKSQYHIDGYDKPSIFIFDDNTTYIKFSFPLQDNEGKRIKYTVICRIDFSTMILELRFDRVGIAYKKSYTYYREKIDWVLKFFKDININIMNIDFKEIVEYIETEKSNEVLLYGKRMNRNGSTAYLEALDDDKCIIPILGELNQLIEGNMQLFNKDEYTLKIKNLLLKFMSDIEIKSDKPTVKVKMNDRNIKFVITHNYKGAEYSLFKLSEELLGGEEDMNYVRDYFNKCSEEFKSCISSD